MKYTTVFTTLLASAMATPPATSDSPYFGVISARSASPIHLQPLTARGGYFYLGGAGPSSYCPVETVGADACPPGNTTVLAGGDKTLGLGVVVPGGQQVYVGPNGALGYTVAHSGYVPPGSIIDGFSKEAPTDGKSFGYLNFETGFIACPAGEDEGYQVYGAITNGTFGEDCLGFSALTSSVDSPGAWQY